MSKAKKGKVLIDPAPNWDESLLEEIIYDNEWQANLVFLVADSWYTEKHVKVIITAADGGNRKKFCVIDREKMLQMAQDDAKMASTVPSGGGGKKSKQGSTLDKFPHVQVCQQVANCISSNEEVSPSLLARLVKYAVLKRRNSDISDREKVPTVLVTSEKASGKVKKNVSSGRTSKAGKKGKDTPAPDASPSLTIPQKPPTDMLKRGEEDTNSKYINDEPIDGPTCYFLLTGFISINFYKELALLNLKATALVKVKDETVETGEHNNDDEAISEPCSKPVDFFVELFDVVKSSPTDSMLRDMARLDLCVTPPNISDHEDMQTCGQQLFDNLAERLYLLLDHYKQYQEYLKCLDIQSMPVGSCSVHQSEHTNKQNLSSLHYDVLNDLPQECSTVPLIVNSMVEQVSSMIEGKLPVKAYSTTQPSKEMDYIISSLKISSEDDISNSGHQVFMKNEVKPPAVILDGDTAAQNIYTSLNVNDCTKVIADHKKANLLSAMSSVLTLPKSINVDHDCLIHMFNNISASENLSLPTLRYALLIMSLEHVRLPNASTAPGQFYHEYHASKLLFDHPFNLALKEYSSTVCSEVDSENGNNDNEMSWFHPSDDSRSTLLEFPIGTRDLGNFSGHNIISKDVLLQTLQHIKRTHPYVSIYHCRHSNCNVLIAHTGYDGNLLYKYDRSIQAASKVAFQNYLEYLLNTYGSQIDDISKHKKQTQGNGSIEEKLVDDPDTDCLKATAPSDDQEHNCLLNKSDCLISLTGYDLDDTPLIGKESVYSCFSTDGVHVQSERYRFAKGPCSVMVSIQNEEHTLSANLVWDIDRQARHLDQVDNSTTPCENNAEEISNGLHTPTTLNCANFVASLNNYLKLSVSCYGAKGDGSMPYLPLKDKILGELSTSDSSANVRSLSQQSASQKLSKKQLEQQQQLLEQQKLVEEQRMKEREAADVLYKTEYLAISRNNKCQQFFATTHNGLHLHCQIVQNFDASDEVLKNPSIIVRQSLAGQTKSTNTQGSTALSNEKQRCYLPNGNIVCYLLDGSVVILSVDGTIYRPAKKSHYDIYLSNISKNGYANELCQSVDEVTIPIETVNNNMCSNSAEISNSSRSNRLWLITVPTGEQYLWKRIVSQRCEDASIGGSTSNQNVVESNRNVTEVKCDGDDQCSKTLHSNLVCTNSLHISKATDPVTKEVFISREDGVVITYRPDGSHVVQFVDGTRCTMTPRTNQGHPLFLVECPGLASLTSNPNEGKCTLTLPDSTAVLCSNDGNYVVEKNGKCLLDINAIGKASYATSSGGRYTFEYTGTNKILHARDHMDNGIEVDCQGQALVDEKRAHTASTENPYLPKFFLVDSDGKCAELLKSDCVASVVSMAEEDSRSVVFHTDIPGDGVFSTILKPLYEKDYKSSAYSESEIFPSNIRDKHGRRGLIPDVTCKYPTSRFGVSVGRGLMVGTWKEPELQESVPRPGLMTSSQLQHGKHVTDRMRQEILSTMRSFKELSKGKVIENSHCIDPNPKGIVRFELVMKQANMFSLYDKAFQKIEETKESNFQPCSFPNEAESIKQEEDELHAFKTALKQNDIPPYLFKFPNVIASPDMEVLTSKLSRVHDIDPQQVQSPKPVFSATTSPMFSSNLLTHPSNLPPEEDTQSSPPTDIHSTGRSERSITEYTRQSPVHIGESKCLTYQDQGSILFNKSIKLKTSSVERHIHQSSEGNVFGNSHPYPIQQLVVEPDEVNFGTLKEGHTYQCMVSLRNIGINPCRFKIKQPPQSTGIEVFYSPGQIAAGLCRSIKVELFTMGVSVVKEHGRGSIYHTLEITSEMNSLYLPIKADILTSSDFNAQGIDSDNMLNRGVKKMGHRHTC